MLYDMSRPSMGWPVLSFPLLLNRLIALCCFLDFLASDFSAQLVYPSVVTFFGGLGTAPIFFTGSSQCPFFV
jgi:hypothetical protein